MASDNGGRINRTIVRAHGKGKHISFDDALTLAKPENYAELHGNGGASGIVSAIRASITNEVEGGNSYASFNAPMHLFGMVRTVCEKNFGTPATMQPAQTASVPTDFKWNGTRVNTYRRDGDKVFVSEMSVQRSTYRNGRLSNMPWYIGIKNFWAVPKTLPNGTTAYDSGTVADAVTAYINLTDEDMYRCCVRIEEYVNVWAMVKCVPMVRSALQEPTRTPENSPRPVQNSGETAPAKGAAYRPYGNGGSGYSR